MRSSNMISDSITTSRGNPRPAPRGLLLVCYALAWWGFSCPHLASAAVVTNVNIVDFAFNPSSVTVNVNDQVQWTWVGSAPHSTTSNDGLWDSGLHTPPFTFTNSFPTSGTFPYICSLHRFAGSVTVQGTGPVPPAITSQPQSQTVTVGQNASFVVAATGTTPLSYQWHFNGADIAGATTTLLTLVNVQPTNADSYSATVTNVAGLMNSAIAVLTLASAPTNAVMTVQINGNGTVTPNYNGQLLVLGNSYSMTADPAAGYLFSGWTGSLSNSMPLITFVMASNLVLQASFTPGLFIPVKGTYYGLFYDTNAVSQQSSGSFTLTTKTNGAFSGSLQLGSAKYAMSGQFGPAGKVTKDLTPPNHPRLTVALQVDLGDSDRISGTVKGGNWMAQLTGNRAVFDGR